MPKQSRTTTIQVIRTRKCTGATLILVVILLPALFALAALAINIAYIESSNTEVQIAVDAAARAAGRTYVLTGDQDLALAAAQEAASRNPVGNFVVPIAASDLEFGTSLRSDANSPYEFTPSENGKGNSIRLTTNNLSSGGGTGIEPVFPFFGGAFTVRPLRTAVSTQGVIDIALVVDRSGSMAYGSAEIAQYPPAPASAPPDWDFGDPVPPNARWLDLIAAVQGFISELDDSAQEELLSLSIYNHNTNTPQLLTTDYNATIQHLAAISTNFEAGGTAIGRGIYQGMYAINESSTSRPYASKVMIVMTDGVQNWGGAPEYAARAAADAGITLFTITFSDEAEQIAMQNVADIGGGEHFHAETAAQLKLAFQKIARRLPTLLTQ
ncbi:vWA domain-containing protein [Rubripirellula reticaptiva]|uniref:von Willebrand factor type A domain protein n=1 Tax=Rubripirellula reticaptiva TaxID=2528013 RepID=A0A5C6EWQ8_9BACT|nr:vWA domain-containing protein [Rubripirellula reticaptiva]TWU51899.1 von Willebrand factor type A domain protein [Rubripirellula reticaptiva]